MITYKKAGVDIKKADKGKEVIIEILEKTFENRLGKIGYPILKIGHYSGIIDLGEKALGISTDGVGSKILLAEKAKKYDTLGFDLMGMLANDLIVNGLEPLAVVDYLACEKPLKNKILSQIALGLSKAAKEAGVAIVGGETAILPGMVKGFDLAGTIVGIAEKEKIITGEKIIPGDALIGIESSGLHSNGYTLARKVLNLENKKILRELLAPSRIYVKCILDVIEKCKVHGLAHITGSAYTKLRRLKKGMGYDVSLPKPRWIFKKIQEKVSEKEMYKTFNMGIGFIIISPEPDKVLEIANNYFKSHVIGRAKKDKEEKVTVNGITI